MTFQRLDLGAKMETNAVERLIGTKKPRAFVIVDPQPFGLVLCHIQDFGQVYANEATKERKLKESDRYLFLVGELLTDLKGNIVSQDLTPKFMMLAKSQYEQIIDIANTFPDITKQIIQIECEDEKYQKNVYTRIAEYTQPLEVKKVCDLLTGSLGVIQESIAKTITAKEVEDLLATPEEKFKTDTNLSNADLDELKDLSDTPSFDAPENTGLGKKDEFDDK